MAINPITGTGALPLVSLSQNNGEQKETFVEMVGNAVDNLQSKQSNADDLATKVATGELTDVHDYMIASTEAALATELTVAVRNKAIEAFNEIMRMPV